MKPLKEGIHFDVPRSQYEADPGINQSALKAFLYAPTPAHFRYEEQHAEPDPDYIRIGNAIDCLVSSPSDFKQLFAVTPENYPCEPTSKDPRREKPWTLQSNWCKDWWKQVIAEGKTPLTIPERDRVRGMVDGLERHEDIPRILSTAHRQVCLIAVHPKLGYRMKALLDVLPDVHSEWIYDLKSFGQPATPRLWFDQVGKQGYHIQAAYYLEIARLCGIPATKFGWPVVESQPPHEPAVYWLEEGDEEIEAARKFYTDIMPQFVACRTADDWPGHSRDWIKVKLKPWQLRNEGPDYERLT